MRALYRNNNGLPIDYMLKFQTTNGKKWTDIKKDVSDTLNSYGLKAAYKSGAVPVTCDGAISPALQQETISTTTCCAHTVTRIIKRLVDKKADVIPTFSESYQIIKDFLISADKVSNREECNMKLNDYLFAQKLTHEQKLSIAKLNVQNYDTLTQSEQKRVLSKIVKYPTLNRIHELRFRGIHVALTDLLKIRPVFIDLLQFHVQQTQLIYPYRLLDWNLVKALHLITSELLLHLNYFESNQRTMAQLLSRLLRILEFSLAPCESQSGLGMWLHGLKKQLCLIMFEYLFGESVDHTLIKSRSEAIPLLAYFLDFRNAALSLKKIQNLIIASDLEEKDVLLNIVIKSSVTWSTMVTETAVKLDQSLNKHISIIGEVTEELACHTLDEDGYDPETQDSPSILHDDGSILSELEKFKNFGKQNHMNCKSNILITTNLSYVCFRVCNYIARPKEKRSTIFF